MTLGVKRNANRYLVCKSRGQDLFWKTGGRVCEGIIKEELKEMGWEGGVEWINLA
jgi:hypothetical protein